MPVRISDVVQTIDADGVTAHPVAGVTIKCEPDRLPIFISTGGAMSEIETPARTTTTATDGTWSISLPRPGEQDPAQSNWILTLSDGTAWIGVPPDVAGPVTVHDLKNTYGWELIKRGPIAYIQAIAGPTGATGPSGPVDFLNVRDYGAAGDGVNDDTAAFQRCVSAMISTGKTTMLVPTGTYKITGTGVDFSGFANFSTIIVQGSGSGSRILCAALGGYCFSFSGGVTEISGIRDLMFVGKTGVATDTGGVLYISSSSFSVERCRFSSIACSLAQAVLASGSVRFKGCGFYGVGLAPGATVPFAHVLFTNWGSSSTIDCQHWDVESVDGVTVGKGFPSAWITVGRPVGGASNCHFLSDHCHFDENAYQSIRIDPTEGGSFPGAIAPEVTIRQCTSTATDGDILDAVHYNESRAFIRAINVKKLFVDGCNTGVNIAGKTPWIWATNCASTRVQHSVADPAGASQWQFDSSCTFVEIIECDYQQSALVSPAGITVVQKNGVRCVLRQATTTLAAGGLVISDLGGKVQLSGGGNVAADIVGISLDATWTAWAGSTAYVVGDRRTNGGNLYQCSVAGVSASSGGPSGTGVNITDGAVHWFYVSSATVGTQWVRVAISSGQIVQVVSDGTVGSANDHVIVSTLRQMAVGIGSGAGKFTLGVALTDDGGVSGALIPIVFAKSST